LKYATKFCAYSSGIRSSRSLLRTGGAVKRKNETSVVKQN